MENDQRFDILIKQVEIIDGTGSPAYTGDIGVVRGGIARIGRELPGDSSCRVVRGDGLTAAPGFIDAHSHDDVYLLQKEPASAKLYQGVTSVVTGNCGMSVGPVTTRFASEARQVLSLIGSRLIDDRFWPFTRFSDYLSLLEETGPSVNVIPLVGHLTLRTAAMGLDPGIPGSDEMGTMLDLFTDAMRCGAFGLSTGLVYNPGLHAGFEELVALAKIAGKAGGVYASHIRSEGDRVLEAMEEALTIGARSGASVHISHHKVMGEKNWNRSLETLDLIEKARAKGIRVTCDVYPYIAGSTILAAAIPPAYQADGLICLARKLERPEIREIVKMEIEDEDRDDWENLVKVDSFDGMVINHCAKHPDYSGRSIGDIAASESRDPYDVMFDLIVDDPDTTMIEFMMSDQDVERIIKSPFSAIGSDGIPGFGSDLFHPRFTGSFPRVLGYYVREKRLLSLEEAIRKMTSLPADIFGLRKKGRLAPGYDADIVLFDPEKIRDKATFKNPGLKPEGVNWVFVNGQAAVMDGCLTEARAGRVLVRGRD